MSDAINKPAHYNQGSIECIDAMKSVLTQEEFRGYLKGNVFKCLWREKDKNGNEDLRKGKSYYDRLIELVDESEQQKAADLQSLKDYPFGKLKEPAWTPKIGDWVRINAPEPGDPMHTKTLEDLDERILQVVGFSEFDKRYSEFKSDHGSFYVLIDLLEPAEPPKPTLNSDNIPEGYRKLNDSSTEPRQLGDLRWSVAEQRYVEIGVDEIGYANRDNWAACRKVESDSVVKENLITEPVVVFCNNHVCQLAKPTGITCPPESCDIVNCVREMPLSKAPQSTQEVKPPDGWRWLEVDEVIRKGDRFWYEGAWHDRHEDLIGCKYSVHHCQTIRRNKFEVGEKVVHINGIHACAVVECDHEKDQYVITYNGRKYVYESNRLAPYIEESK